MTNKERLEEVISRWNRERDDYDWLVEQARQVEYLSRIIDSQNQSLAELMVENKRYREALEFYADEESWSLYDHHGKTFIGIDGGMRARKALKDE